MKSGVLFIFLIAMLTSLSNAQQGKVGIGISGGLPYMVGIQPEFSTPLFDARFKLISEVSFLQIRRDNRIRRMNYESLGFNYYFFKSGSGLYSHLGYGRHVYEVIDFEYYTGTNPAAGSITTSRKAIGHGLNVKVGFKTRGKIYFRSEAGYRISADRGEIGVDFIFPHGTEETQTESVPGEISHLLLLNAGIGYFF